jgi:hypothetical protein
MTVAVVQFKAGNDSRASLSEASLGVQSTRQCNHHPSNTTLSVREEMEALTDVTGGALQLD